MPSSTSIRLRLTNAAGVASVLAMTMVSAHGQMSLGSAVGLALASSPRVQAAQADVVRARAQLAETHDVYVPTITAGAAIGQAYGYSPYPPTLFTLSGGSLVYNPSQFFYIRSARAGIDAAQLALQDVQESVAEDTALAFVDLVHDQQREEAVRQQSGFAGNLARIAQDRFDAGQDSRMALTQAKLTAAQLRLSAMRAQDDAAVDREHLAHLVGVPPGGLRVNSEFPAAPTPSDEAGIVLSVSATPGVASAFANAEAKQQQANGDDRFRYRPQINLAVQYNRYATFTNAFADLKISQPSLGANDTAFGVQISIPLFDRLRSAKARESAADAVHAYHEAQNAQFLALDGQSRLRHSIAELQVQSEVATLEQQLAQQQLDAVLIQLESGTGNSAGPQLTPKDEQNARIDERQKYLDLVDARYHLEQSEIHLMRQTGQLDAWLKSLSPAKP